MSFQTGCKRHAAQRLSPRRKKMSENTTYQVQKEQITGRREQGMDDYSDYSFCSYACSGSCLIPLNRTRMASSPDPYHREHLERLLVSRSWPNRGPTCNPPTVRMPSVSIPRVTIILSNYAPARALRNHGRVASRCESSPTRAQRSESPRRWYAIISPPSPMC